MFRKFYIYIYSAKDALARKTHAVVWLFGVVALNNLTLDML